MIKIKYNNSGTLWRKVSKNSGLYLLLLPAVVILFIVTYLPMVGIIIAFKDFKPTLGIFGSPWAGLNNFLTYFNNYNFGLTIKNTLVISIYSIIVSFPLPIILALLCNQMRAKKFKKFFQVSTYLPHFISTVVMCGMIILFLSPSSGIIAKLLSFTGYKLPNLMGMPSAFASIYVWSDVWQHTGWDSILYIAALSAIDPSLYEAAVVDGASKWQKIIKIDIPLLMPTAVIMLILRAGGIMNVGFEKVYLLHNMLNLSASETIATYVYRIGLLANQYSVSAAVGLFNNMINLLLLVAVNAIVSKVNKISIV